MLLSAASRGVTVTQPEVVTVSEGRDATIECKTEPGIYGLSLHWYQQKPGETPKLIIYLVNYLYGSSSSRFQWEWKIWWNWFHSEDQWSPDWRCCTLLLYESTLYQWWCCVHTVIKSRTKTSVSQSHGDWTDPAAASLTQQWRNTKMIDEWGPSLFFED